jgi:hypothetical protein
MVIFSHIEHILHNHFATFRCDLGFLKFLTFSWWSVPMYRASLADGILGFITEVLKATPFYAHPSTWTQWTSVATRGNERNKINVDLEL